MNRIKNHIKLEFSTNIKYTEFCVLILSFLKKMLKISEEDYFKIEISLREIVNNAIIHGNALDKQKTVSVGFEWTSTKILLYIQDQSQKMVDFTQIRSKIDDSEILSISGRGIAIVINYMDHLEFHPSPIGTKVIIEKKIC